MLKKRSLDFGDIELLNSEIFSIRLNARIIIELGTATELINTCNQLIESGRNCGCIIDMSEVAFVTEDARNFLTNVGSHKGNIMGLALVSNNHLGNIISTLMISFCEAESIPMKLFKNRFEAESWVTLLIEKSKFSLLQKTA